MFNAASATALLLATLVCVGCGPEGRGPSRDAQAPIVDEQLARQRALEQYRRLFKGLYLKGPRSGELIPFPDLDDNYFRIVESRGDAWLVRSGSETGLSIVARVAKTGDLVEITSWSMLAQ
jgi:hypothetical protein